MSATETSAQPVYVYGVVKSSAQPRLPDDGVGGKPLERVDRDGIAALVSELPQPGDLRVRRRDLVAHLRSLEQVFAETTVAPCSFGTVLDSRAAVEREFLAPRRDELRELLDRLEGQAQMNVKVEYDEEAIMRAILSEDAEVARTRERARALGEAGHYENIRLGELVAASLAARRARDAEWIVDVLGATASDVLVEPAGAEGLMVFKGSFLVHRASLPAFDDALERLAEEPLRIDSFGPLPPTAFATLDGS